MGKDVVLKAYKKRERALQRRISAEHDLNKELVKLLLVAKAQMPKGPFKDLVDQKVKNLKYKYY